ncbi:hypothetical protein DSAG12_03781 [Promethearchaeum syntrophicum]|uniref:Histidine kinase N-terminal 7TM region domain-containing protein n=1 Tax=Promethearchaeum syntrophicum TaxID=2594042 RepID=A0A5B9DGT8_9ARCH|nr:hypothetical protein [Candidatus Prometheoarchaeum syntrophicum]QEE17943.1 hypothetical protein DSAG12_03781 [Candidatus Prometheoarchaeum syntrophicum]
MQLLTSQEIQSFVFNSVILIIFCIFAYLLIHRNKNRISTTIALYFITVSLGLVVNIIYRAINIEQVNIILNILTIYLITFAGIHLLNFNNLLFFSTKVHTKKKVIWLNIIYAVALSGLFVIGILFEGVEWINDKPKYSILFGLYGAVWSQIVFAITVYYTFKISKKMGKNIYSRKYLRSIIGILCFDLQLLGGYYANTIDTEIARTIGLIVQLVFILPGAFFIYFGIKKVPES